MMGSLHCCQSTCRWRELRDDRLKSFGHCARCMISKDWVKGDSVGSRKGNGEKIVEETRSDALTTAVVGRTEAPRICITGSGNGPHPRLHPYDHLQYSNQQRMPLSTLYATSMLQRQEFLWLTRLIFGVPYKVILSSTSGLYMSISLHYT
jgi:hypothetical protein